MATPPTPPTARPPQTVPEVYPARLAIDYPTRLNRVTTAFRLILIIPIVIILSILSAQVTWTEVTAVGTEITRTSGGISGALFLATLLMILFRKRYPQWWFAFARELTRFGARVGAYLGLLTDTYPSTVDEQSVHLELDYPDVEQDLNRGLPLVKWFLAIPHFFILFFLWIAVFFVTVFAWFAILFTGRYPQGLFGFVVGVGRWSLRVSAYSLLLLTDRYPPFSLD
jgi:hypothetical protein